LGAHCGALFVHDGERERLSGNVRVEIDYELASELRYLSVKEPAN